MTNPVILKNDVKKWNETTKKIKENLKELTVEEESSFDVLSDYWRRNFDSNECADLIKELKSGEDKHIGNRDLLLHLKDFASLCTSYYTKTETEFNEFKKALGGRMATPIHVPPPAPPSARRTPPANTATTSVTPARPERLNYDNGDYYIGEVRNRLRHGQGKYYSSNGDWSESIANEGSWVNGKLNGQAISYVAKHKRADRGEYRDGYRVGRGIMIWENGDRYEGTWDDTSGNLNGQGIYYYANGSSEECRYVDGIWERKISGGYQPPVAPSQTSRPSNYLGLAIVSVLLCWPLSIFAIVNAAKVKSLYSAGNYSGASRASRNAKRWAIWAFVAAVLYYVIFAIISFTMTPSPVNDSKTKPKTEIVHEKYIVNTKTLNIRTGPGTSYSTNGVLSQNNVVEVVEVNGEWAKINYKGKTGYVSMTHLEKQNTPVGNSNSYPSR